VPEPEGKRAYRQVVYLDEEREALNKLKNKLASLKEREKHIVGYLSPRPELPRTPRKRHSEYERIRAELKQAINRQVRRL
jgi:hypothetical protein